MQKIDVSIIIETDNLRSADAERARQMMAVLADETAAMDKQFEVLVYYDDEEIDESMIKQFVIESGLDGSPTVETHFYPACGSRYYELKNIGGKQARGDILVFLDSDVIPERGWLAAMVGPFDNPTIQFNSGDSYISPLDTVYERAFALFWIMKLRLPDGPLHPTTYFSANNFAMRRKLFERFPIPDIEGDYRGHCSAQAKTLIDNGITIWRNPEARVTHPPPKGFLMKRALWMGHDRFTRRARNSGGHGRRHLMTSFNLLIRDMGRSAYRILFKRKKVDMPVAEIPLALALATAYWTSVWVGFVGTKLSPRFVHKVAGDL